MLDWLLDFHFLRPLWLLGVLPFLGLWAAIRKADRLPPSWRQAIVPELLEHLVTSQRDSRGLRPLSLLVPVGLLGCVAMAGPAWELVDTPLGPDRSALVVAFELSDTMDGRDVGPTRAERARFKVKDLLEARGAGQTGLVAYAGSAHVVMPLTDDDAVVVPYLDALSPEIMPVPGNALENAVPILGAMLDSAKAPGTILLVTDGVTPAGADALTALVSQTDAELVIYQVGTDRGDEGRAVPALDEASLGRLARATGAAQVRLTIGEGDVRRVLRILDRHRRSSVEPGDAALWKDAGYYLLFPLAALLLFWFRRGWVLRLPYAAAVLLSVSLSGCAGDRFADLWFTPDQQGQRLFDRGKFTEAAERFDQPMWRGVAYYAAEDWASAIEAFAQVTTPEGYYNLGNAYAQNRQYITAIQQYDQALGLRPTFREARSNRDLLQDILDGMQESVDPEETPKGPPPDSGEDSVELREDQKAPEELQFPSSPSAQKADVPLTDEALELWMRRVDTRPADFLAQKFSAQAPGGAAE